MTTQIDPHFTGLSEYRLDILKTILKAYVKSIDKVCVFGSRAQGTERENSDIDLVIYGDILEAQLHTIHTDFIESALPVSVDIVAYNLLQHEGLKKHIDIVAKILFTPADLQ